jgi:2-octaprenyl-3-methyl-6-methoxy-1,4-benzoquinol hydroxylase
MLDRASDESEYWVEVDVNGNYDVIVVGGGMVGAAAALGLCKQGLRVAIVEQQMPQAYESAQGPDMRVSAISLASETLLSELGAWQYVLEMRACPYRRLAVWERNDCKTEFNVERLGRSHLGHIVENRIIQLALHQALQAQKVSWYVDSAIDRVDVAPQPGLLFVDGQRIRANLLIGADGFNSKVREASGIGSQGWQYSQQALGIKINTHAPQADITWQQFTADGPLAFLPLFDGYASLVWYGNAQRIKDLKSLNQAKLKQQIQLHFPAELTDFDILDTASFPLTRMHANQYVKGQVLLIGDAAHSINPLAGQGVNLGFKDVQALLEALAPDNDVQLSYYADKRLQQYEQARRRDNLLMMTAMDVIYATFSNDIGPLKLLRNVGLKLADKSGPLKTQVMKYAMGL